MRGQVCKRIARRIAELKLENVAQYRARIEDDENEAKILDALCRVTISRFYRDRGVWDALRSELLPELIEKLSQPVLRCWSAGCASGEEPYTLALLYEYALRPRWPELRLDLIATDADAYLLERAERASYREATLRELPEEWKRQGFVREGGGLQVRRELRERVRFARQDIREEMPAGPLHLLLCRNVVFTYLDESVQRSLLDRFATRLVPGGLLVIGAHEIFPGSSDFAPVRSGLPIFRRNGPPTMPL